MEALGPLSTMVLGFVVVMAGVSMLVSQAVRVVQRLTNRRARALAEMLADVNQAFRSHHGDYGVAGDSADTAFVVDVLNDVALAATSTRSKEPLPGDKKDTVEFIARDTLIAIIKRHAVNDTLPRRWHVALPAHVATGSAFESWLQQWFTTIEGTVTERFRKETGRKVLVISAFVVALLNLDAFQLSLDLFNQAALASDLAKHAPGLVRLADEKGTAPAAAPSRDQLQQFVQINSILNLPELKLGWQRGAFIEKFCAWSHECDRPASLSKEPPDDVSDVEFWLYVGRWFFGLVASTMLLWLGAPFWADRLRRLLGNAVEKKATK